MQQAADVDAANLETVDALQLSGSSYYLYAAAMDSVAADAMMDVVADSVVDSAEILAYGLSSYCSAVAEMDSARTLKTETGYFSRLYSI